MTIDTLIIGGGMVGATLALALPQQKITLIDATPISTQDDPRLIALNFTSIQLIQKLNLWMDLKEKATAIDQVHVSQQGKFGITRIHHHEVNLPTLGYLIPAKDINAALDAKLKTSTHIEIIRPAKLNQLSQTENAVTITVTTNQNDITLVSKKLFAADGTHSTVRELLDIPTETIDYQQSALVTITQLQRHHQHIAYERFLDKGAIAMLPMRDNRVATIWTSDTTIIQQLMQQDDATFLNTLQKAFGYRLGRFLKIEKRHTYPLKFILAKAIQKQHVTLLGNALHTVHPLAAQGLNLALNEIAMLTSKNSAIEINTFSLKLSHHLNQLFSADFFILNTFRKLGMIGLDLSPRAKKYFMRKTLGQRELYEPIEIRD